MRARSYLVVSVLMVAACGGGGDDGGATPDARVMPTCEVSSTIETMGPAINGYSVVSHGYVTCDVPAAILLKVCVQGSFPTTFQDVQCEFDTKMAITVLEVDSSANCNDTDASEYRTNSSAMVDGVFLSDRRSDTITCP